MDDEGSKHDVEDPRVQAALREYFAQIDRCGSVDRARFRARFLAKHAEIAHGLIELLEQTERQRGAAATPADVPLLNVPTDAGFVLASARPATKNSLFPLRWPAAIAACFLLVAGGLAYFHFRGTPAIEVQPTGKRATLGDAVAAERPKRKSTEQGRPPSLIAPFTPVEARRARKAWAAYRQIDELVQNSLGMKFALIPPSEFQMGSPESPDELAKDFPYLEKDRVADEQPLHRVRITAPFYLGIYEVTKAQFRAFVDSTGYQTETERTKGGLGYTGQKNKPFPFDRRPNFTWRDWGRRQADDAPVINVTWNDASAFCAWLNQKEGKRYRLPTEAEWEYACRAGTTTRFYNGNGPEKLEWAGNIVGSRFPQALKLPDSDPNSEVICPAGRFPPNHFGLYDMLGNAAEWCQDWYAADWYAHSPVDDPSGPFNGTVRVLRGGCWYQRPAYCRAACRWPMSPYGRNPGWGFRVALSAD